MELFFVKPESMDSINGVSYYLKKCRCYETAQMTILLSGRQRTGARCMQHSLTAAALSTNTAFE